MNRPLLLFLFLALAAPTFAQSTAHVLVTVTGDLSKLSKDTISVSIDGTPATVSGLSPVPAGSSKFVLLIDVSGSNKDKVQFEEDRTPLTHRAGCPIQAFLLEWGLCCRWLLFSRVTSITDTLYRPTIHMNRPVPVSPKLQW